MANKVNPIRKAKVKESLLNNKSIRQSMLKAGYSKSRANNGADNKVYQEVISEIRRELKEEEVTIQVVIQRLNEDRCLAIENKDYSTATRVDELLGKFLAMFTDKIQTKDTTITPQLEQELRDYLSTNRLS